MGVSCVCKLKRYEIIRELARLNVDTSGNLVQIRQRLVAYVKANSAEFLTKPNDEGNYKEKGDRSRDLERAINDLNHFHVSSGSVGKGGKWRIHSEIIRPDAEVVLLQGFPELLRGDAQLWYRNTNLGAVRVQIVRRAPR